MWVESTPLYCHRLDPGAVLPELSAGCAAAAQQAGLGWQSWGGLGALVVQLDAAQAVENDGQFPFRRH